MFNWLRKRRERRDKFAHDCQDRMKYAGFVPGVTEEDVRRIIRRDYPNEDVEAILDELRVSGPCERVHAAILKLANGNRRLINENAARARVDFRDVIILAESPLFWKIAADIKEFVTRPIEEVARIAKEDETNYRNWLYG